MSSGEANEGAKMDAYDLSSLREDLEKLAREIRGVEKEFEGTDATLPGKNLEALWRKVQVVQTELEFRNK